MERINFQVSINNRNPIESRKNITLEKASKAIQEKGYDKDLENFLIQRLKSWPENTYELFLKNISKQIAKYNYKK